MKEEELQEMLLSLRVLKLRAQTLIEESKKDFDDEGYQFITNMNIREELPFEIAYEYGYKFPHFKWNRINEDEVEIRCKEWE